MASKSVEDYLEAIYNLVAEDGIAKTGDISRSLNVRPPSVTEMLQRLAKEEFVTYEKYGGARLTAKGERLAKTIKRRHDVLVDFLNFIGVGDEVAEEDACRIEHDLNPRTVDRLQKFLRSLDRE